MALASHRVHDRASFAGDLRCVSADKSGSVKVLISTDAYGEALCEATQEIGQQLNPFLLQRVKVSGSSMWYRPDYFLMLQGACDNPGLIGFYWGKWEPPFSSTDK